MKKLILTTLTCILLFSGCTNYKGDMDKSVEVSAVQQAQEPQESQESREVFIFAGKIQANNVVNLGSKISPPTKVSKVTVDVGSTVNAGDAIIYLDTTDLQMQKAQAEAKVDTQKAALDKTLNSVRSEDISIAQSQVENDEVSYKNCENNYNRIKELYDSGGDIKTNLEAAESALSNAKSKLDIDKETLAKDTSGATSQDINVSKAGVKEAEAAVNYYQKQIENNGVITSPISGTVSVCNIHEGEIAASGSTLVTIINNDSLYIDGYIPGDIVDEVKVGQEVIVKVADLEDKRFKGEISVINPVENSNNKNVVRVMLKEGSDVLKSGMVAQVGFNN